MVRPCSGSGSGSRRERRDGVNNGRYKGVRMRKWGKWVAEVRQPNSRDRIWLGSYETAEEAARAYDAAVFCLRGPSALINFPSEPPDIPVEAAEMSPTQIQVAAARHARGYSREQEQEQEEEAGKFMSVVSSVVDEATVVSPSRGELDDHEVEEDSGSLFGDYSVGRRSKECYNFPVEGIRGGGDDHGGGGDEEDDGISTSVLFERQRLWTF